ncbi:MAG: glycosyltransferase family 2 protein [Planctomycetaceae bacterium]|nr:glycosyltransferase family 2 protein [Planctomycetaceae bacterium]
MEITSLPSPAGAATSPLLAPSIPQPVVEPTPAELERLLGRSLCRQLGVYELPPGFCLSVVVPVFNELNTVAQVVEKIRGCGVPTEIILVDDGSTDGTRDLLAGWRGAPDLQIIFHERNRGKGAALRTGFQAATGDVVIVQDADLEYDPAEFRRLIQPIVAGEADVVFGSRFSGHAARVLYFRHRLGNWLLTFLSNLTTNLNLTDMETCYKAFRGDLIRALAPKLRENRFGIEPELTARTARIPGVRIFELPVSYRGRTYAEGKKINWRDGVSALRCIWRYRKG